MGPKLQSIKSIESFEQVFLEVSLKYLMMSSFKEKLTSGKSFTYISSHFELESTHLKNKAIKNKAIRNKINFAITFK